LQLLSGGRDVIRVTPAKEVRHVTKCVPSAARLTAQLLLLRVHLLDMHHFGADQVFFLSCLPSPNRGSASVPIIHLGVFQ
jgi:hypothetical protein